MISTSMRPARLLEILDRLMRACDGNLAADILIGAGHIGQHANFQRGRLRARRHPGEHRGGGGGRGGGDDAAA